jgi:site-specific DNA recombinase
MSTKRLRCAIYTRKSSDEGLEQAFNSLHAQREACEAYIKSQAHEGWRAIQAAYDDGGVSGATMERPALRRLLAEVDAGQIDTIVVYKIDRLTRTLADFARIVERLDARGTSFVSVTQAFNTTSSMGRLTLNVLLSFAQFEREVTGERIRDKIAASKKKGLWMGGVPPLGYRGHERTLAIVEEEAALVRTIFSRYLELGSVHVLQRALQTEGVRSRSGAALSRGALFHLLKNRLYLGEIVHKGQSYPGQQAPIMATALFDQVQAKLETHRTARCSRDAVAGEAPLTGRLFDAAGLPMSPSFTRTRTGRIYRYYVSSPLQQGGQRQATDLRIAAPVLEEAVRVALIQASEVSTDTGLKDILDPIRRIDVLSAGLCITVDRAKSPRPLRGRLEQHAEAALGELHVPVCLRERGGRTWTHVPQGSGATRKDPVLIAGLHKAHRLAAAAGWQLDGTIEHGSCSAPENTYERSLVRLAFLAPELQKSILDGRQPASITLEQLVRGDVPIGWRAQATMFGTKAHLPTA